MYLPPIKRSSISFSFCYKRKFPSLGFQQQEEKLKSLTSNFFHIGSDPSLSSWIPTTWDPIQTLIVHLSDRLRVIRSVQTQTQL